MYDDISHLDPRAYINSIIASPRGYIAGQSLYRGKARNISKSHSLFGEWRLRIFPSPKARRWQNFSTFQSLYSRRYFFIFSAYFFIFSTGSVIFFHIFFIFLHISHILTWRDTPKTFFYLGVEFEIRDERPPPPSRKRQNSGRTFFRRFLWRNVKEIWRNMWKIRRNIPTV